MPQANSPRFPGDESPKHCSDCPLHALVLYAVAVQNDPAYITGLRATTEAHGSRHVLLTEGEVPKQVFTLFSGWAFQFHLLPDGRRQIFSFLLPGDFIGVEALSGLPSIYSVQALTRVHLCVFDTNEMAGLFRDDPRLRGKMASHFFEEVSSVTGRLIDIGRRTATERIVRLILDIEERASARGLVTNGAMAFPLRQTHIADALGLTAVHVNRTINALRREGLITLSRGTLTIENRSGLTEIGGYKE